MVSQAGFNNNIHQGKNMLNQLSNKTSEQLRLLVNEKKEEI